MRRYTLDASGLLRYFVDGLPPSADDVVQDALDGEAILELPAVAAGEAMYTASNRTEIAGRPFRGDPTDVVTILNADLPIVLAPTDLETLEEMLNWHDEVPRQLHDALIVASHVVNETEAVISTDGTIADHVPTVWE